MIWSFRTKGQGLSELVPESVDVTSIGWVDHFYDCIHSSYPSMTPLSTFSPKVILGKYGKRPHGGGQQVPLSAKAGQNGTWDVFKLGSLDHIWFRVLFLP